MGGSLYSEDLDKRSDSDPEEEELDVESASLKKAWVIVAGREHEISGTSRFNQATQREKFLMAVNAINLEIEAGEEEVAMKLLFELSDEGCVSGTFAAETILDPNEFLDFEEDQCHPEIYQWHRTMMESPREPGDPNGHYVYFSVVDEEDGTIGRITAKLQDTDDQDIFRMSVAFCHRDDTFSRNVGRMMVEEKFRRGHTITAYRRNRSDSNFMHLYWIMDDIMNYGSSDLIVENHCVNFPEWIKPSPQKDIPKDVNAILHAVAYSRVGDTEINKAKELLGLTGKHRTKFINLGDKKTIISEHMA